MSDVSDSEVPIITVDGPSGTGKGTICSYLTDWLQWNFLDSGALYRVLALAAQKREIVNDNEDALAELAENLNVEFKVAGGGSLVNVVLDGEVVTDEIRTEEAGNAASLVAPIVAVRKALLSRQKAFHKAPGLVADGRDMGTVVFPDATLKIYLTASAEERAKRRLKQLMQKGISANLRDLSASIAERDERDSTRAVSPLKPAEDAIIVDTSTIDIDAVVAKISELVVNKIPDLPNK
ncbi:MAG TPA: (d)CMP kinase [Thiotrichaceae bacterium]|jgi:cytidylate kinase|nr:(d)CMP kinase [Thiotrichaceae bacterium]HIM09168.1 (d)CMP kinase [Gammaproteobacteria bacterium]